MKGWRYNPVFYSFKVWITGVVCAAFIIALYQHEVLGEVLYPEGDLSDKLTVFMLSVMAGGAITFIPWIVFAICCVRIIKYTDLQVMEKKMMLAFILNGGMTFVLFVISELINSNQAQGFALVIYPAINIGLFLHRIGPVSE